MFNMTKIRASNASGKSFYANHLAANDYYSEHEKVTGFWRGSLAERFGLTGQEVTGSVFSLFQRNINPAMGDSLTQKKVSGGPRFFDFQVAAPKSVSVMSLFDERLIAAHQSAVREAMYELEALAAVRIRNGENVRTNNHENTGKLIYAEFMHDTSRALDPQLHTHNVVCNVTFAEGKYKALETLEMCKAIRYAGKVYHNALARQCRELGYDLVPVLDKRQNVLWFDLAGVPSEVMERFSKRRKQIEEAEAAFLAEHGRMPTLAENNAISSSTRAFKMQTSTREAVRNEQLKQLSEDELEQLKSLVKPDVRIPKISREEVLKAIRQSAASVFERESVVTQDKLLAEVLNTSLGLFDLVELKRVLREVPELKNLGGEDVNPYYSPEEVIEREIRSIEAVEDQKGVFEPIASEFVPFPDEESRKAQSEIITGLLASPDRFNLFRGVAGSGKTSTLQEFCRGLRSGGVKNIVLVAPTNSATEVLKLEGFDRSQTAASFLLNAKKPPEKSYIIIDEAGLNSLREGYEILKLARKNNYRVLFVGDAKQHNAVESGDFFRLLEDYSQIRKFSLTEIHRQQNEEYRRGIFECSQGQFEQAFERFDSQQFIHESRNYLDEAAAKFLDLTQNGTDLSQAILVSPTHAECDRLTAALRERLKAENQLGGDAKTVTVFRSWNKPKAWLRQEENIRPGMVLSFIRNLKGVAKAGTMDTVEAIENGRIRLHSGKLLPMKEAYQFVDAGEIQSIELRTGDLIQFRANRKDLKIYNGTLARVSKKTGWVDLLDGSGKIRRSIELPEGYAALDYGWVTTSHKSQGRTAQNVIAAAEKLDAKAFYVSLSRGRQQLSLHCPDKALLKQHLLRHSGNRAGIHDLIRDREIPPNAILPLRSEVRKQKAKILPNFSYKDISSRFKRTAEQVKRLVLDSDIVCRMRRHRARIHVENTPREKGKSLLERFVSLFRKPAEQEKKVEQPEPIAYAEHSRTDELWKIYDVLEETYRKNLREYHERFGVDEFQYTKEEEKYFRNQAERREKGLPPDEIPAWMEDWESFAKREEEHLIQEREKERLDDLWRSYKTVKKAFREYEETMVVIPQPELWAQVCEFMETQKQRIESGLEPEKLPESVLTWHMLARYELLKVNRKRKEDPWTREQISKIQELARKEVKVPELPVLSRSEADACIEKFFAQLEATSERPKKKESMLEKNRESTVEKFFDPEKYTGSRDPKVQTEILNLQIRALARAGFIQYIPADRWRNMSPAERLEIVLSVPENERKKILQNVRSSQYQRPAGRRIRTKRDYDPEL